MRKVPVVFLDRDGVINESAPPHQYITRWEDFKYLPGAPEGIRKLTQAGHTLIVVSNQRGIARGMITTERVEYLNRKLMADVAEFGGKIHAVYYCPHDIGDHCSCRKPGTGMLEKAASDLEKEELGIDRENSWIIGDFDSDIQAGIRYGINTVHIRSRGADTGGNSDKPDDSLLHLEADSLLEAAEKILEAGK